MDLLTIVVPVYNTEPYLEKTLHSLCSQTYTNLEILLIDDGSSDNSLAVCKEWAGKDSRIRVFTQENSGVSAARNRGIALAGGQYLMFMDADDWIEPDMLETLHDLAVTHHADVANCILREEPLEESDRLYEKCYGAGAAPEKPDDRVKVTSFDTKEDSGLALLCVWGPVCKLYRTELVRKVQFENYQVAEDLLFNTNVILQEDFARTATIYYPFYHYVIYPGSAMKQKFQKKYLDAMKIEELCYHKLAAVSPKYKDINLIGCSVSRVFEKYAQLSGKEKRKYRMDFAYGKQFAKEHKKELLGTADRHRKISGMLKIYVPDLYICFLSLRYRKKEFSFEREPGQKLEKEPIIGQADGSARIPAISIVTPYYNSDEHLEQTFRCVMNQTFADFEWVIVDDGSTRPEAVEKLEQLAGRDVRIRVIHQENGGQSVAKNRGIRSSRADIIVFLDADDLIEDFYLEILYQALKEHPDAAWSFTDLVGFGSWQYLWCKPFSAGRMTFNNTLVNAAAFRKSALESVDCFTELYKHYDEDWALYLKLLGAGYHPVHVPVIGFWYRRSENGMQQSVRKDDELRKKSDAYMEQLSRSVDIHIRGEEYKGTLPEKAVRTDYSRKEKLLTGVLAWPAGVTLISRIYKKKAK